MKYDIYEVQEKLLQIWTQLLPPGKDISIDIEFKALGGDSMFAMRVISEVWDVFNIELSPGIFFDRSSIEALSEYIVEQLEVSMN